MEQRIAVAASSSATAKGSSTLASVKVFTNRHDLLRGRESCLSFVEHATRIVRKHGFKNRKYLIDVFDEGPGPNEEGGYTGVITLEESHLAWHSWPDGGLRFIAIDLNVCDYSRNNESACEDTIREVAQFFQPHLIVGVIVRQTGAKPPRIKKFA